MTSFIHHNMLFCRIRFPRNIEIFIISSSVASCCYLRKFVTFNSLIIQARQFAWTENRRRSLALVTVKTFYGVKLVSLKSIARLERNSRLLRSSDQDFRNQRVV